MIRIVLADDHKLFRQGLHVLLEGQPDFQVVGEAADGLEAIRLAERLKPDVLVLDLVMPGLHGLDAARLVNQTLPGVHIIILSMHTAQDYALEGLRNGISGYVIKDADVDELVQAVRAVMAGQHYFSAPLSEKILNEYALRTQGGTVDPYETLTNREREVLTLLAEGHNIPRIAERLSISRRTVETHRDNVLRKLSLKNRADLIRYVLTHRLTLPE